MKVAIVDDEKIECDAMTFLLGRCGVPLDIVFQANNGRDAVSLYDKYQPDLLIIDIQMPQMSGLDALREIRRRSRDVQVIIISAYDEFSYAQEALRLGAAEYLLKPCNTQKLYQAVRRAAAGLSERERKTRMDTRNQKIFSEIDQYAKKELLDYMIVGAFRSEWVEDYITHRNHWKNLKYHCAIFRIPGLERSAVRKLPFFDRLEEGNVEMAGRLIGRNLVCLFLEKEGQAVDLSWAAKTIGDLFPKEDKKEIGLCDGDGTSEYFLLPAMYHRAEERLYNRYPQNETYNHQVLELYELENQLIASILRNDGDEIYRCLAQIARQVEKGGNDILQNRGYCAYLWRQIDRKVFQSLGRRRTTEKKQQMDYRIGQIQHVQEMVPLLNEYIQDYASILKLNQQDQMNKVIEKVKECIQTRLSEDISLDSVAEQAGFSAPYLSKLFKKTEGVKFKEYLISARMELAKKLLDGRMTIAEVAEAVGYPNADYFSTIFKKHCGFTASEYRKRGADRNKADQGRFQ